METKTNITLRVDKELVKNLKKKKINLSHFFEQQAFRLFEKKEAYIQIEKRGDRIIQKLIYINAKNSPKI